MFWKKRQEEPPARATYMHECNGIVVSMDKTPERHFSDEWRPRGRNVVTFHSVNGKHYRMCVDDSNVPYFREMFGE